MRALVALVCLAAPAVAAPALLSFPAPQVTLHPIAQGFAMPLGIVQPPDATPRLFIVEQSGKVWVLQGGTRLAQPFLDVSALVSCCGERGLLGIAFAPDHATSGRFYIDYTDRAGDTVVARYRVSADPNVADPASAEILLQVDQPFSNHNGGLLAFGPDGMLYVALGDGGSAGDPQGNGQDYSRLLGSLLRLDVRGARGYAIPPDNPFGPASHGWTVGAPEVWAKGLRNPWRFSFDRATGDLWTGDVGQNAWEEVSVERAGSAGGLNYGWNVWEGTHEYEPAPSPYAMTFPVLEYQHTGGRCSITGGYVYRGSAIGGLQGHYVFADYCTGEVWGMDSLALKPQHTLLLDAPFPVSTFGEDRQGELYLADYGGGRIYALREPAS